MFCLCCRLEDALQDFTAAIDTDPSSALSFNSRALLLERLGQPAAALADHDAAVALDARDAGYIKSRGLCARTLGQYEAAVRDFSRWVSLSV
jgi:tetratricopeptide (TPR) repeat protein